MIQTLFILATLSLNTPKTAQVSPCVWPKCVKPAIVQVSPCVWPKCVKPALADFKVAFQDSGAVTTCDWPKKCDKVTL